MNDKQKSLIVSRACVALIADLKSHGLDDFEILSSLLLIVVKKSICLKIPKNIVGGVLFKLYEGLENKPEMEKYVFDFNIEA